MGVLSQTGLVQGKRKQWTSYRRDEKRIRELKRALAAQDLSWREQELDAREPQRTRLVGATVDRYVGKVARKTFDLPGL
jgi:hypothetical protein